MIKVGLLTINDYSNYGNRLQNYALQEVLISLGCSVKTIVQDRISLSEKSNRSTLQKIKNFLIISNKKKIELIKTNIELKIYKKYRKEKIANLKKFTSMFINEESDIISVNKVPQSLIDKYDYFITGSDQVWNPNFGFGNEIDFIEFAPKNKRISYAASFGISVIPDKYIEDYKKRLTNINRISVREEAGAEIVRSLTGKEAIVLVDPTLLIDKNRWIAISTDHIEKPVKKYLLTYMLGDIKKSYKEYINKISKENNLEVVNLASYKDKKRYAICPREFIDYFNSAEIVITNSFHGVVFSILLEKAFIVLSRGNLNSRIDTLLKKFKLEERKFDDIIKQSNPFKINYLHVSEILEKERNKSCSYLKNALGIENKQ